MRSWAEINLDNLRYNINTLKSLAGKSEVMPVIKANAYGHGLEKILEVIVENVNWIGVATLEEAQMVRNISKVVNVLVLGPIEYEDMRKASSENIAFLLTSMEEIDYLYENNINSKVHIKVDTGMGRVGFSMSDLDMVIEKLKEKKSINVEGIFSHLSSSDTSKEYTEWQLEKYKEVVKKFPDVKYKHVLNSFGAMRFDSSKYDIIRVGIILYGGIKEENSFSYKFKPVMSLKARVSFVKTLENKMYISYNRAYEGQVGEKIATVSIGYADGVRRDLSNKGEVFIKNRKCKMIGTICMDQLLISVPEDLEVNVGDTVELFGENIHVEDVAEKCNTISYEILCGISSRIPRIYKGEEK